MPLAAGGMARIYIGRSIGIGNFERHVVLKLITPERANDHTAVQMFLDEARLAASLNHQNVAQVFEVGEDLGIHYLAMEYVHGQDLRALLAKAGSQGTRIPLELALTVVAGAAAGLNHAHERRGPDGVPLGIVHRDVSPSNIMMGYDGAVKLLDFGIAKATARSIETQSGIIKGKFAYMAPEQCRGRDVDRRSDVFSLGIILYEISTQHRCFRADSDFDTMHRIVTGDVVRPTRLIQGYPQALEAIVMKALAVDANQRYQSAGLLLEAIESFAVSARMSLSTMALGRFMRDMFGEMPEPWTSAAKDRQPTQSKENTISSTAGRSDAAAPAMRHPPPPMMAPAAPESADSDARFPGEGAANGGRTVLDLPRGNNDADDDPPTEVAGWNAKSYPTMQPSIASSSTLPPDAVVRPVYPQKTPPSGIHAQPGPAVTPQGSQPMAAQRASNSMQAFAPNPGSGSGPAHQAHPGPAPVSTRHGYASGAPSRMDSYPRLDSQPLDPELQLRPNRRPLYIGVGVVALGLIIILAATLGGGGKGDEAPPTPAPAPEVTPGTTEPKVDTTTDDTKVDGKVDPKVATKTDPKVTKSDPKVAKTDPKVTKTDGTKTDGTKTDGTKTDGTKTDGTKTDGTKTDGTKTDGTKTDTVEPKAGSAAEVEPVEDLISINVDSDPQGADVILGGKKIGVTPLNKKIPRAAGTSSLIIHHAGYADVTTRVDLAADFSKSKLELKKLVPPKGHPTDKGDKTDRPPPPPKPKCQPAAAYNPFDTSCPGGTACPVCK
jgi:serine/threonine-protein kinase